MLHLLPLLTCFAPPAAAQDDSPRPPNLLFIMVDDLGPEWISCYGGEDIETPNIDKMAAGGMLFQNAYSMPKCTPTRATLLTGQYPFRHGWVNHWDVPRWGAGCHFDPDQNPSSGSVFVLVDAQRGGEPVEAAIYESPDSPTPLGGVVSPW